MIFGICRVAAERFEAEHELDTSHPSLVSAGSV